VRLHELTSYLASCGVATFLTVAQQGMLGHNVSSPIDVSYIADTMFLMRFFEAQGRVRKALSVIKKRTGPHETTIREIGVGRGALTVGKPSRTSEASWAECPNTQVPLSARHARKRRA
jgi:circadian clock protein KaiC